MAQSCLATMAVPAHQELLADIPAAVEAEEAAQALVERILECGRRQMGRRSGQKEGKQACREDMLSTTFTVSSGLMALASNTGNALLAARADYSRTKLARGKEADVISRCETLLALGNENAEALAAKCKVLARDLKALETAIKDFKKAQPMPRQSTTAAASATRELPGLFEQLDEVFQKQLDPLLEKFKDSAPSFYNEYRSARTIVDEAVTRSGEDDAAKPGTGGVSKAA